MNRLQRIGLMLVMFTASIFNLAAQVATTEGEAAKEERVEKSVDLYTDAPIFDSKVPQLYRIRKVNVHGVESNPKLITIAAGIVEGDSIYLPGNFTSTAIQRLWEQKRFSDIKMGATFDGSSVDLDLYLKERPRVYNWNIEGVSKTQTTSLMDDLDLKRNSELSDFILAKSKVIIKKFYDKKGFRNATIDVRIENDPIRPQMVNVTFVIDRKERVKIGEITFSGNENIEDSKLRKSLKDTHQKSINIFKSAKLKEADYESDKEKLIDYYNSQGYRNATIVSDTIYDINDKRIGINIEVSEGNKYYIRNISWVGNSVYDTDRLQYMFGVESGDTYDKKSINKRLGLGMDANPDEMSVLTLYQNEGYLMSQVDPSEVIVGADSIDLELKVFEGKPYTVNNVKISGNSRVDEEVVRRELYTRPGELYNRGLLMQTIRTLGSMGHFNPEAIMPKVNPVSNELVDIEWPLEEQASDQFNISGGWGANAFVASIGVTLNNLSIRNMVKGGAWTPYPMGQNQKLSITGQSNGTYYKAFSMNFTDPWLGGKKPNSLTVAAYYSDQNDAYYAWESPSQYFRTLGVSVGIGKRLTWPDPYFTFYTEATYQRYMLDDWSSFVMTDGTANMISAKAVLTRNSVDQPTYPRRGSSFNLSLQLTPPFSLWDGKDYTDNSLNNSERYKFVEFHKWQVGFEWYQGFLKNSNLVLMLRAEMGYLGHYNPNKVSPFERFDVGGDGMSGYSSYGIDIISIRGYEDGVLNPSTSEYANGYNKYTMELRYPVVLNPSSQVYALGFLEAGNGFSDWSKFSPFNIKRSAGVGVRVYMPILGTLGVDWGWGFDAPNGDTKRSGSQFHFVMGQQF